MGELSTSEEDWNKRASLNNYRCRVCRNPIAFADQELYFAKGLCTPCSLRLDEERNGPNSASRRRLEEIRGRGRSKPQPDEGGGTLDIP